jgi:anti-sigma factor RsiW
MTPYQVNPDDAVSADAAPCAMRSDAQGYFDDALPPGRKAAFARHLAGCAACTNELTMLARIHQLMELVPAASPQFIWRTRATDFLRDSRRRAYSNAVLRVASAAVGVAAAVLLASGIWSTAPAAAHPAPASPVSWEAAAVGDTSGAETADASSPDGMQAQWVVSALDSGSSHD